MKLHYLAIGLVVIIIGLLVSLEAPLISKLLLTNEVVIEIPRKDFRLRVKRVWQGDVLRLDFDVKGGDGDLYLHIERVHFYIGPRLEQGAPSKILTTTVHGPSLVNGSDSITLNVDLEGHLNILLNNTYSPQPKTVTLTTVFERSTNVEYATKIIRNLMLIGGGVLLLLGLLENYDEIRSKLRKKAISPSLHEGLRA